MSKRERTAAAALSKARIRRRPGRPPGWTAGETQAFARLLVEWRQRAGGKLPAPLPPDRVSLLRATLESAGDTLGHEEAVSMAIGILDGA